MRVDPITLEVMRNALYSITDEMSAALVRTAYSTNIKDRRDCSCAMYAADGKVIAQSEIGTPIHLGVMPKVISSMLQKFPIETMEEGDHYMLNTPYPAGPGHLNDITLMSPIHYEGKVIALVANQAHYVDVGGYAPGSMPFNVWEIFQEGIQIPAVKIVSKGKFMTDIVDLIQANIRTKNNFRGDFMAQAAANNVGRKRLLELVAKNGIQTTLFYTEEIMNYSERRMRAGIRELPDGVWEFEDFLEGTGIVDDIVKLKAKVEIRGDEILVDMAGSSPQVRGPINCRKPTVEAAVYYTMKCIVDPGLPPNDGAYRPISVEVTPGSVLSANYPASVVQSNIVTTQRIVDTLLGAMLQAVPNRVCAACSGTENIFILGGTDPRSGNLFTYIETYGGGQGATHYQDGMSGVHTHMTNTRNAPVEIMEQTHPLLVTEYALIPNSEGAGKYRGGFGMTRAVITEVDAMFTIGTDRGKFKPWGVFGGHEASGAGMFLQPENGEVRTLPLKCTVPVQKGDLLKTNTPGGGGWGDPFERDAEKVLWDVMEGLVSIERAASVYGVAIDAEKMTIDHEETKKLRGA